MIPQEKFLMLWATASFYRQLREGETKAVIKVYQRPR